MAHYLDMKKINAYEPTVEWGDYVRLDPGIYQAYCKLAKWYKDPGFKRWTCILKFDVMAANLTDSLGIIPIWFNGGDEDVSHAGRRSGYFAAWVSFAGQLVSQLNLPPIVFHSTSSCKPVFTKSLNLSHTHSGTVSCGRYSRISKERRISARL